MLQNLSLSWMIFIFNVVFFFAAMVGLLIWEAKTMAR